MVYLILKQETILAHVLISRIETMLANNLM